MLTNRQSLIPVVMAGIIAVYALVIAVLVAGGIKPETSYTLFEFVTHFWAFRLFSGRFIDYRQWSYAFRSWPFSGTFRPSGRLCHWYCWRFGMVSCIVVPDNIDKKTGSSSVLAAITYLRWYGVDLDLRRGVRTLWVCWIYASILSSVLLTQLD